MAYFDRFEEVPTWLMSLKAMKETVNSFPVTPLLVFMARTLVIRSDLGWIVMCTQLNMHPLGIKIGDQVYPRMAYTGPALEIESGLDNVLMPVQCETLYGSPSYSLDGTMPAKNFDFNDFLRPKKEDKKLRDQPADDPTKDDDDLEPN